MQKLFSAFPDSWPGFGLVILRVIIAFGGFVQGICILTAPAGVQLTLKIVCLVSMCVSLVLVLGLLTPIVGAIATASYFIISFEIYVLTGPGRHVYALTAMQLGAMSLTLVLLGPGAYSLDARLFGRREIIIPDGRRPGR